MAFVCCTCLLMTILLILPIGLLKGQNLQATFSTTGNDFNITHNLGMFQVTFNTVYTRSFDETMSSFNEIHLTTLQNNDLFPGSNRNNTFVYGSKCCDGCSVDKTMLRSFNEVCKDGCFPFYSSDPKCHKNISTCQSVVQLSRFNNDGHKRLKKNSDQRHSNVVFGCDNFSVPDSSFLYIRSCRPDLSNHSVRAKCAHEIGADERTVATFARVSDNETKTIYYNKYCAMCNNATQPVPWELVVSCVHYQHVYSARSQDEFLRLSLEMGSSCHVRQQSPADQALNITCVNTCYERIDASFYGTGQSSESDRSPTQKSENDTKSYLLEQVWIERSRARYYKNIFCATCELNTKPRFFYYCHFNNYIKKCCTFTMLMQPFPDSFQMSNREKVLPFSLLLGSATIKSDITQPGTEPVSGKCSDYEWSAPDGRCLLVQCTPGKHFRDGQCSVVIEDIKGLGYTAYIFYLPNKSLIKSTECMRHKSHGRSASKMLNNFIRHLQKQNILDLKIAESELQVSLVHKRTINSSLNFLTSVTEFFFYVEAHFIASINISRDEFEKDMLHTLTVSVSYFGVDENCTENATNILVPMFIPGFPFSSNSPGLNSIEESQTADVHTTMVRNNDYSSNPLWYLRSSFITFSRMLSCAYVSFNRSDYTVSIDCMTFPPQWTVSLKLGYLKLTFHSLSELKKMAVESDDEKEDGTLKVCLDLLDAKIYDMGNKHSVQEPGESIVRLCLYYLTLTCMSLSALALFITVLGYILIAQLRNEAGINNMFLSGTLLLAQLSLISSSHVDGPSWLCTTLGISTHFLWLSTTSWSLICCVHMFRVFTAATRVLKKTATARRNNILKKIAQSILLPAFVVATVTVTMHFLSGGERIGYTNINPCYLDSDLLIVAAFVAPLGLVTFFNLSFFVSTVYRIHGVKKLQTHASFNKNDRDTFVIYIKLSTITGVFWALAILAEHIESDILRFIAVIMNGLQGVFLFLSFACNKRV